MASSQGAKEGPRIKNLLAPLQEPKGPHLLLVPLQVLHKNHDPTSPTAGSYP